MLDGSGLVCHIMAERLLAGRQDCAGLRILVTAGPTRERIDPVRYISNDSSGKMGYAIAEAARARGAEVTLVSGPVALQAPAGVALVPVETTMAKSTSLERTLMLNSPVFTIWSWV